MVTRFIFITLFVAAVSTLTGFAEQQPRLGITSLTVSPCIENCKGPEKVTLQRYTDHKLELNFTIHTNCANKKADVLQRHDTVRIELHSEPQMFVKKNGDRTDTTYSYVKVGCSCYYNMEMIIDGLTAPPSVIIVNNRVVSDSVFVGRSW